MQETENESAMRDTVLIANVANIPHPMLSTAYHKYLYGFMGCLLQYSCVEGLDLQ